MFLQFIIILFVLERMKKKLMNRKNFDDFLNLFILLFFILFFFLNNKIVFVMTSLSGYI